MKAPAVDEAVRALQRGDLVIFPTDTLFALGCVAANADAVDRVFRAKRRPPELALPFAVADRKTMATIAEVTPLATRLADRFLPGGLTLVLARKKGSERLVAPNVTPGRSDLAVRIPRHDTTLELARRCGPLVVTSANFHGDKDPPTLARAKASVGPFAAVALDSAAPLQGKASTIVDARGDSVRVLRKGVIDEAEIRAALE